MLQRKKQCEEMSWSFGGNFGGNFSKTSWNFGGNKTSFFCEKRKYCHLFLAWLVMLNVKC